MTFDRIGRLALTVGLGLGVVACAGLPLPLGNTAVGPCTLKVTADERGQWRVLQPPYRVRVGPRNEPTALIFSGTGWTQMDVRLEQHGSGVTNGGTLTQEDVLGETTGFSLDHPGRWQVRLSDDVSGCMHEFVVDVGP